MSLTSRRAKHLIISAIKDGRIILYKSKRVCIDHTDRQEDLSYYDGKYNQLIYIYSTAYNQIVEDNDLW